jgi:GTP-binding nuclear protein Ran
VKFVAAPALAPAEVPLDMEAMKVYERELDAIKDVPLPADDDL